MKLIAPCKGCLDRVAEPNCHETCEEYLLFKWLKEEQKAKERKEKELDAFHNKLVFVLNPIIDWTTDEVWEFIHRYNVPYCELYDQGFTRLGCIGCPMSAHRKEELDRYPKFKEAYLRAFDRMIQHQIEGGGTPERQGQELYEFWTTR